MESVNVTDVYVQAMSETQILWPVVYHKHTPTPL